MPTDTRTGKRALVVFLDPETNEKAYALAVRSGWTRQEYLARAMNCAMEEAGMTLRLPYKARRVLRVPNRKRRIRDCGPMAGKTALAGWYPASSLDEIQVALTFMDTTFQDMGKRGVHILLEADETRPRPVSAIGQESNAEASSSAEDAPDIPTDGNPDAAMLSMEMSETGNVPPAWIENTSMQDDDLPDF